MPRVSDAKKNHRELEQYHNIIISAKDSDDATRWQNQVTSETGREELVVSPGFEKLDQQGKQMADRERAGHQTLRTHIISKSINFLLQILMCSR